MVQAVTESINTFLAAGTVRLALLRQEQGEHLRSRSPAKEVFDVV